MKDPKLSFNLVIEVLLISTMSTLPLNSVANFGFVFLKKRLIHVHRTWINRLKSVGLLIVAVSHILTYTTPVSVAKFATLATLRLTLLEF